MIYIISLKNWQILLMYMMENEFLERGLKNSAFLFVFLNILSIFAMLNSARTDSLNRAQDLLILTMGFFYAHIRYL